MEILDRLFDQFLYTAKENLQKDGYVAPFIFLLGGQRTQPEIVDLVPLQFETEEDKDQLARQIEERIRQKGAWGYLIVNEAWILDRDDLPEGEFSPTLKPSQHPQRREAVWVALFAYDYHRGVAAIFERQGGGIVFTKELAMEPEMSFAGRFAEMLPPMN